jgi:hypothetical protein
MEKELPGTVTDKKLKRYQHNMCRSFWEILKTGGRIYGIRNFYVIVIWPLLETFDEHLIEFCVNNCVPEVMYYVSAIVDRVFKLFSGFCVTDFFGKWNCGH